MGYGWNGYPQALNKCYLVFGPESSGTRLLAKLLITAGCSGEHTHEQRFDTEGLPAPDRPIVWRRSFPHAREWPNISDMVHQARAAGYQPVVLVTTRDHYAMVRSQVAAGHVSDAQVAQLNIEKAYLLLFCNIAAEGAAYRMVEYLSLVTNTAYLNALLSDLGLSELGWMQLRKLKLSNANTKWYKG
jgi:hypothetical protein